MENETPFRVILLVLGIAYLVPRFYYRRKVVRANLSGESELRNVTESRLRLALMGISGLGTNLLVIAWIIHPAWLSWSRMPLPDWLRWVGVAMGVVAVWLGYLAHRTLGTSYTATLKTVEEHQIVVKGVYRWIRHPMYTSFFAVLAADFLLTSNWLIGVLGMVYSLLIVERVGHEERMMLDTFGEEYRHYMRRTGRFFPRLLQSRPITTLRGHNPATGEWNDSLTGDYLWTNANFGEAFPDVMTPFTWSIAQVFLRSNGYLVEDMPFPLVGNIAGRLYMNLSVGISAIDALGLPREKVIRTGEETFGRIPPEIEIPTLPLSRLWVLGYYVPMAFLKRGQWASRRRQRVPAFIAETPALAENLRAEIRAAQFSEYLLILWREKLQAHLDEACQMLLAGLSEYRTLSRKLHIEFENLVGDADANALLSGVSTGTDFLASLGLLMGLAKVSRGEMSREQYLRQYGHRGPHEMELSYPRPVEDPGWIDRQLAEAERDQIDVPALLTKQRQRHQAAWEHLKAKAPRKTKSYRRKLDRLALASKTREAVRSEAVRFFGLFRAFALRAGELTGLRDDIFLLSLEEVLAALDGDEAASDSIPARRETHARYSALPPYPTLIRGRFDPFQWAADPNRRSDLFDTHASTSTLASDTITGFAGAAGRVKGLVRRLDSVEEGDQLQPGEVLVTVTTNIGWTPLFPRAAAIVTDVGAPLSHAAIVARELGIPAVVGCSNGTMRLHTGDRVLVDGGRGIVEILDCA